MIYLDFILNYPDDAYKYVVTLLSTMLLLLATYETIEPTKLRSIGEVLNTLSEELESHTLTFMLMLEKTWSGRRGICYCENTRRTEKGIRA